MAKEVRLDIDKIVKSYETVESIETHVSTHNFHEYFFDMEDLIDEVNLKHDKCFSGYQERVYEIIESIDKIKNKINLLSDSLRKTIDKTTKLTDLSIEQTSKLNRQATSDVQYRESLSQVNNDSSQEIISIPTPKIEETKQEGLFPEGYNTTPIGLGIGAAGITGAIGAVVIDSMMPKSAKKQQPTYEALKELDPKRPELPRQVIEEVEIMVKYEGYIKMQEKQVEGFKKLEKKLLPDDVDYNTIKGIRLEARQKLNKYKPYSIGQASRISGVSPADISVLLIFLEQYGKTKKESK